MICLSVLLSMYMYLSHLDSVRCEEDGGFGGTIDFIVENRVFDLEEKHAGGDVLWKRLERNHEDMN